MVTIENLKEYVKKWANIFVIESTKLQINAFKKGFEELIPIELLKKYFYAEEINMIFCGEDLDEAWTVEIL